MKNVSNTKTTSHIVLPDPAVAAMAPALSPAATPALAPSYGADSTVGLVAVGAPVVASGSTVLTVGVGKEFATIGAAVAAAASGDTILVDAGTYTNDFATISTSLTLEGVGGMVNMVATVPPPNLKGIITVDNNVSIANFSFSGCAIDDADGGNGAGIRYEGGVMSLYNDAFSNNQDGILANAVLPQLTTNTITINHCDFNDNGTGTGYTHNVYIGDVSSLVFENSISQDANVGHELKSRAESNTITNNLFTDGATGDASYEIDLPDGGVDLVTGNTIVKGPDAQNDAMVHFGGEGIPYAGSSLTLSGNSFVNNYGAGALGLLNQTSISATIEGNQFVSLPSSQIVQGPATGTGNVDGSGNALPDISQVGVLPGNTTIYTDNLPHTITMTANNSAVEGGGGLLTIYDPVADVVVIGGSGGVDFYESAAAGASSVTTQAGSVNIISVIGQDLIDSQGTDSITTGGGNVTGTIGGTATVNDGAGTDIWTVNGTATFTENGGTPQIAVGPAGSATITGSLQSLLLQNDGGTISFAVTNAGTATNLTIAGGAATGSVWEGATSVTTSSGGQGATLTLGAGTIQVTSAGADTIYAGSGTDTVIVSGAANVYSGTGSLSVFGRSDAAGANVFGNGGTVTLSGDTGNLTYFGGKLANTVLDDLSRNTFIGGSGLMTINGGSDETIEGGSGGLVFNELGGGANTIVTQSGAADTLNLSGSDQVSSWGNDAITAGAGNMQIAVFGTATINGSTGTSALSVYGTATLTGHGQDWVTLAAGANLTETAGTLSTVTETGATFAFSVATGAFAGSVSVAGGSAAVIGGTTQAIKVTTSANATSNVTLGSGTICVASDGADVIHAGSGPDVVAIYAANTVVWGGSGSLTVGDYDSVNGDAITVHGGSGALSYAQGGGALTFVGGAGQATLSGGWGSMSVVGGAGSLNVSGGGGSTVFVGGTGAAMIALNSHGGDITFGGGITTVSEAGFGNADLYHELASVTGGSETISGFRVGTDKITEAGGVKATASKYVGGTTEIDFSNKSALFLVGVNVTARILGL